MKYAHRDRANRAVPVLGSIVLGGVDLALFVAGPALPWGVRIAILVVVGFAAALVAAAVPAPARRWWLLLLVAVAAFTCFPPSRTVPHRLIFAAGILAVMLGLLVWHARQKRTALWARET